MALSKFSIKDKYDPPESPRSVGWTRRKVLRLTPPDVPWRLDSGGRLSEVEIEYETYGELNAARDNVVLVLHALSGDAHVAGWDAEASETHRPWRLRKPGWWDAVVGPGKALDTRRFHVICSNVLGGCYGTTGPRSICPETGRRYGLSFPRVTVGDWVKLQARLLDRLGIERLYGVVGGSLGGQQAIEWAMAYPERVARCIVLAAAPRLSAQGLAFNAVGRYSIMSDPSFQNGDYEDGQGPNAGLAAARMLAHITYLSESGMHQKFGRRRRTRSGGEGGFGIEFEVESYLEYQGRTFVERFDADAYLYITRAMDYYDCAEAWGDGDLAKACERVKSRMLVVAFSSDWLYPPEHCREFAWQLCRAGKTVSYAVVPTTLGHDAFLVESEKVGRLISSFFAPADGRGAP